MRSCGGGAVVAGLQTAPGKPADGAEEAEQSPAVHGFAAVQKPVRLIFRTGRQTREASRRKPPFKDVRLGSCSSNGTSERSGRKQRGRSQTGCD